MNAVEQARPDATAPRAFAALLVHCRGGFEKEAAQEITAACAALGTAGFVRSKPGAAFIEFVPHESERLDSLAQRLRFADLVFARQLVWATPWLRELPTTDRVSVLVPAIAAMGRTFGAVVLETADTNEAKELAAFCRKFTAPLEQALKRQGLLRAGDTALPRLHLFFADSTAVCIGVTFPGNASPWPMGVPRLRVPPQAPSRSTMKLAEALHHWLTPAEDAALLHEGTTAVDLGAAPGGWTWQLVRRGVQVTAVDNGPLAPQLLASDLVEHVRADGFRYRPPRPVQWLVCDMVEQPLRVAELVADWLAEGLCEHAIFNLKLPMKKRHEEVARCRAAMEERWEKAGIACSLRFRHLYHDREEITGYAVRTTQARKKRPRRGD